MKIHDLFRKEFNKEYWEGLVSHGVPRWKNYIAWAKERAKQIDGYIEGPKKSGRGFWQLTLKGQEKCAQLREELSRIDRGDNNDGH